MIVNAHLDERTAKRPGDRHKKEPADQHAPEGARHRARCRRVHELIEFPPAAFVAAWHDARFTQYLFFDEDSNTTVNVAGDQLPLSPRVLASAGVLYTPPTGLNGTVVASYVGRRYLDEEEHRPGRGLHHPGGDARLPFRPLYDRARGREPDQPAPPGDFQRVRQRVVLSAERAHPVAAVRLSSERNARRGQGLNRS